MVKALNARQELFVQGVVSGKSATQAYLDAGYAKNEGTDSCASILKGKPRIREEIAKRLAKIARKSEWTREFVLDGLRAEAEGREDSTPASRVQAYAVGAKVAGLITDRVEHSIQEKPLDQMTPEERRTRIADLKAQRAALERSQ